MHACGSDPMVMVLRYHDTLLCRLPSFRQKKKGHIHIKEEIHTTSINLEFDSSHVFSST